MPERVSKTTAAPATANEPTEPRTSWLVLLDKLQPVIQRFGLWTVVALGGTYALGSSVNHFFSPGNGKDQDPKFFGTAHNQSYANYSSGGWWNPSAADSHTSTAYYKDSGNTGSSSGGVSVIPANTGMPAFSGTLNLTNLAPIGSHASQHVHDILGLRTGNTPTLAITPMVNGFSGGVGGSGTTLLSFSLSGNIAQVPVNNLEAGGLSMNYLVAVPEPTTGVMLAAGMAGLALTRRRQSRQSA